MTKLDIIVTHYKEPWEDGEKLFQMINLQRGVDFNDIRVMVINDGGHRLQESCFDGMRYQVEQIDIPHGGVSAARNAGIDRAMADWIMFCDFDDTFSHIYAMRDYLSILPADGYDMLWSDMLAEDFTDGKNLLFQTPEKQRFVFLHGKMYRRRFLTDNGIRFNTELAFQEDSEFNAVIIARTPHTRIGKISTKEIPYAWIRRPGSVTNSGRDDEAEYGHFVRNLNVTEAHRLNGPEDYTRYCGMVTRTVWDAYVMTMSKRASTGIKIRIMREFMPWLREHIDGFMKVEPDILRQIRDMALLELADPGEQIRASAEDVTAWVREIMKD